MNWSEWLMRIDAQFINLMCQRAGVRGKLAEKPYSSEKGCTNVFVRQKNQAADR